jgi:hypothetical protein
MPTHRARLPYLTWLFIVAAAGITFAALVPAAPPVTAAAPPGPVAGPSWEQVASRVTAIPKESAVALLGMMKPEGLRRGEAVENFEVRPWEGAADTWLALLSVADCRRIEEAPTGGGAGNVPFLWLALAYLPPPPARPALLARPIGGFLQAREYTIHRYALGGGARRIGPGKQAFVVNHSFNIPFAGGGADVTIEHLFLLRSGGMLPVFDVVGIYSAMYGGDWNEDGSRDHPEEHVGLEWQVSRKATDGFFNLHVRDAEAGPQARRAVYTWQGEAYATRAKDFFPNEQMALDEGQLVPPPEPWQMAWLAKEVERLLSAGDAEGVMGLEMGFQDLVRRGGGVLAKSVRAQVLAAAHKQALLVYKADPRRALRLLGYGICQWSETYVDEPALAATPPLFENLLLVEEPTAVAALNDYAFILANQTTGNAAKSASLLRSVLTVDPKRTVAYLNLADVLWDLGKKDEAREQYRRYRELASREGKDIPPRALQRAP